MGLSIEEWKNLAAAVQSVATVASFVVGGAWVYTKYIRQQERYPNIEFTADVVLIGIQEGFWIAELVATIENKGKAQHKMEEFTFDLNALVHGASIHTSEQWGNQVNFPLAVAQGSFLPKRYRSFVIDPGVNAKYSYIARIPISASFAILHCSFNYADGRSYSHTAERTIAIPRDAADLVSPDHESTPGDTRGG